MTCAGTGPTWNGAGACGIANLALSVDLIENDPAQGCAVRIDYGDGVENGDTEMAFTGFPIELTVSLSDLTYTITLSANTGIAHPWNKAACNPCLCMRCLPPAFCVAIAKASATPDIFECDPCYDITAIDMDPCSYTGTAELKCGEDTYTVSASLPPIENGQCGIRISVLGPGVDLDLVLGGESVGSSTNGCYKCCQAGATLPMSRIGRCQDTTCSDCLAEDPAEDDGCGVATLSEISYDNSFVIEEEGVPEEDWQTFTISIRESWCGERCSNTLIPAPQCCFRLQGPIAGAEHCLDQPTSLGLSIIAPQCNGDSPDNDGATLTLGTMDATGCGGSVVQGGWTITGMTFHACPALANANVILFCELPVGCEDELEPGEYCEFAKLYIETGGNSLGGTALCLSPTFCSCDPLFFEFEAPVPGLNGADPEACPDWCDAGGTMTIRITE